MAALIYFAYAQATFLWLQITSSNNSINQPKF